MIFDGPKGPVMHLCDINTLGQLLLNFDRLFCKIEDSIKRYSLPLPGLFTKGYVDRTSLTFYNRDEVS